MEHMAWKGRIKPGCKAEYQRRHAEIWPEMVKVLKEAGICNYSIFYCKDELFGYYECEKGVAYAEKVQAESPIPSWSRCSGWINKQSREASLAREKMVKLVFYLLYCCAAIKSCGLSGILFKAIHSLKSK